MIKQMRMVFILAMLAIYTAAPAAQPKVSIEQIQWKSESQVRALLGEPDSIQGPVGTHASYSLWKYPRFTIAFANQRAFHMFAKDSLKKVEPIEQRTD